MTLSPSRAERPQISAVINTRNEEHNLPFALQSLASWVDEIIVVDMDSTDRTVEIAESYGAKVYQHEPVGFADPARAFAIEKAAGPWIMMLDADEVVPHSLSLRLVEAAEDDDGDVIVIPWLNYLLGAPMRGTGWGYAQDRHPRFFKKAALETSPTIHNFMHPVPNARVFNLPRLEKYAIHHFNYLNTEHFIEKLNRYTSIEAQQAFRRGERSSPTRVVRATIKEFAWRYLVRRGFRDGWRGFFLSAFMVFYRMSVESKLIELSTVGDADKIKSDYAATARHLISEYQAKPGSQGEHGGHS